MEYKQQIFKVSVVLGMVFVLKNKTAFLKTHKWKSRKKIEKLSI